jgi:methylmalonyl-CoA mutase N-terminal domain/subunit
MRIATDVIAFCERELPRWHPISISGYHMREAGATAVQEVAFTFAHAIAYVQSAIDAGLAVDAFGTRLSFFFNAHSDFLEEVAKFRAARRLWARIMRDRFGATNPRAQQLRFHVQTAGSTLTSQQPDNNIVRVSLQALAAVLGGAQSLHTNARDEALGLPSAESATVALRTQQILLHESGVANTVDPAGGAFAIEEMTNRIEEEASRLIANLDDTGGPLAAVESGRISREIHEAAYRAQRAIESGERVVIGVNRHAETAVVPPPAFRVDPDAEQQQIDRVRAVRSSRSAAAWQAAIDGIERTARGEGNLVPPIIDAVEKRATLGEVADAMRRVFGEHSSA